VDLPAAKRDEKQHVVRHQPAQRPDLGREEVGGHQHLHMRADELLRGGGRPAFWSGRNTMTFEDVAHGLVTDRVPEVGEGADDPIVAPGAMLPGQANDPALPALDRWWDALSTYAVWS